MEKSLELLASASDLLAEQKYVVEASAVFALTFDGAGVSYAGTPEELEVLKNALDILEFENYHDEACAVYEIIKSPLRAYNRDLAINQKLAAK